MEKMVAIVDCLTLASIGLQDKRLALKDTTTPSLELLLKMNMITMMDSYTDIQVL